MNNKNMKILLITPSTLLARGLENILNNLGEFEISHVIKDYSSKGERKIKSADVDLVIIDPNLLDMATRQNFRIDSAEWTDTPVIAIETSLMDEDSLKQFDEIINLYDEPTTIIRKLRNAVKDDSDIQKSMGEELSSREKEILVCVAKGMLNKEIADLYNISIYTVITHRKNITRKTGIKTVAGLTVYALLNNLIDMNSME